MNKKRSLYQQERVVLHFSLLILLAVFSICYSEQVGLFTSDNPFNSSDNVTINVPEGVVGLSASIPISGHSATDSSVSAKEPVSLFFVVDHSNSMENIESDPNFNRIKLVKSIIDTLAANPDKYPNIECGLNLFGYHPYFHPDNNPLLKTPPHSPFGTYLPLVELGKTYPESNGETGHEIISSLVSYTVSGFEKRPRDLTKGEWTVPWGEDQADYFQYNTDQWTKMWFHNNDAFYDTSHNLIAKPFDDWLGYGGTDIDRAFIAAIDAMKQSTNPKENQFIVFISDGLSDPKLGQEYLQGIVKTDPIPATYTIFFTQDGKAPDQLTTMTNAIKNNGYSKTNSSFTDITAYSNTSADALVDFVMDSVITIFETSTATPKKISIDGTSSTNWNSSSAMFSFPHPLALTGLKTDINIDLKASVTTETASTDSSYAVLLSTIIDNTLDESSANGKIEWWDRTLSVKSGSTVKKSLTDKDKNLSIHFEINPLESDYSYSNVDVLIQCKNSGDAITVSCPKSLETLFIGTIPFDGNGTVDLTDNVLTPDPLDEIIFTFRNSEPYPLPLDTLVMRLPFLRSENELPAITTKAVSAIAKDSAVSGGDISSDGGAAVTRRGVCWSTSATPTLLDFSTNDGSGTGGFSSSLTGLTPGTTYYVRAYATNEVGTAYGNEVVFTTLDVPTVITSPVTNITDSSALGGGEVTGDGGAAVTERGICWSSTVNPDISFMTAVSGSGLGSFTAMIDNLHWGTQYYVRAYAINSVGISYGNEIRFTTASPNDAYLTATPGDTTFSTLELSVLLSTNANRIYYTTDGTTPDTTDASQLLVGDSVSITGTTTLRAIAVGAGYFPASGRWTYTQEFPQATLTATPGDTTFSTAELSVLLSTNADRIYYTTDGSAPDTTDSSQLFDGSDVTITETTTLRATAVGTGYLPVSGIWQYIQELPQLYVRATPGGVTSGSVSFYFDTTLTLQVEDAEGNIIEDAEVYILVDDGTGEEITPLLGSIYTGETVVIDSTVRVQALAIHKGYLDGKGSWEFNKQLAENSITVQTYCNSYIDSSIVMGKTLTSVLDTVEFGTHLKLTFSSPGDSFTYAIDGGDWNTYHLGDTLLIEENQSDTVKITVQSDARGYQKSEMTIFAIRDTVDGLEILPEEEAFLSEELAISAYLNGDWVNGAVFIDTNGVLEPFADPVVTRDGITVTFEAKADFAISQKVTRTFYPISEAKTAFYFDADGDGTIDSVTITFSRENLSEMPDTVILYSPFSDEERVVAVEESDMNGSLLSVSFAPFDFLGKTGFETTALGQLVGEKFSREKFRIADRVAPVLVKAHYAPGKIAAIDPLVREYDTLFVEYSEKVAVEQQSAPINFLTPEVTALNSRFVSSSRDELTDDTGYVYSQGVSIIDGGSVQPTSEDSVNIQVESRTHNESGIFQEKWDNRSVPLTVGEYDYAIIVKALTPVSLEDMIPLGLQPREHSLSSGVVITVDFITILPHDNQNVSVSIFDVVGNTVQSLDGISSSNQQLFVEKVEENSTKLHIYWSGKNVLGRTVGAGAYLVLLSVDAGDGKSHKERIMIGIGE